MFIFTSCFLQHACIAALAARTAAKALPADWTAADLAELAGITIAGPLGAHHSLIAVAVEIGTDTARRGHASDAVLLVAA